MNGTHTATANSDPPTPAAMAIEPVSLVENRPWTRPTSVRFDSWVSSDCAAGRATATPMASTPPRTTNRTMLWMNG